MRNPNPNTSGIEKHQFDSDTARKAAAKSAKVRAAAEPLTPVNVKIFARQKAEIVRRGENLSELTRRLLDEYLNGQHLS